MLKSFEKINPIEKSFAKPNFFDVEWEWERFEVPKILIWQCIKNNVDWILIKIMHQKIKIHQSTI